MSTSVRWGIAGSRVVTALARRISSSPIRLGVAGFGRVVRRHYAPALAGTRNVAITAVADPHAGARAAARALFPGAHMLGAAEEICARADVDAVLIALPPAEHYPAARQALVAGKAVFLEKPMTLELADAKALVSVWQAAAQVAMLGYVGRFFPAYTRLRHMLARSAPEQITAVHTQFTFNERLPPPWKQHPEGGGGALRDIAVHHADLMRFLWNSEITRVRAVLSTQRWPADTAEVQMELANGVIVQSVFSSAQEPCERIEIQTKRGTLVAQRVGGRAELVKRWHRRLGRFLPAVRRYLPSDPAYARALRAFLRAVRSGRPVSPDLKDGLAGVAFIRAAEESAQIGAWTELDHEA